MKKSLVNSWCNGFYGIIDPSILKNNKNIDELSAVNQMLKAGVCAIQLRDKRNNPDLMLQLAKKVSEICIKYNTPFIVNDRADIALLCKAHGVHLGQDDLPIEKAREILGKMSIIGISTHSVKQAESAEKNGADYIGYGPVFKTTTKTDALTPRGLKDLKKICSVVNIPVVAIGGISLSNVSQLSETNCNAFAAISDVLHSQNILIASKNIMHKFKD